MEFEACSSDVSQKKKRNLNYDFEVLNLQEKSHDC